MTTCLQTHCSIDGGMGLESLAADQEALEYLDWTSIL